MIYFIHKIPISQHGAAFGDKHKPFFICDGSYIKTFLLLLLRYYFMKQLAGANKAYTNTISNYQNVFICGLTGTMALRHCSPLKHPI